MHSLFLMWSVTTLSLITFADDTELYKSDSPSEAFTLSRTIESCLSDVNVRVVLLLKSIFCLLYVWVRVTSHFRISSYCWCHF